MRRRQFLIGGSAAASFAALHGRSAWAARGAAAGGKRLIVVMLRGAADGLNIVVPHGEPAYYAARPRLAIARPGSIHGALDLDGHFGLHPALSPLLPFWRDRSLAFVHACGSPDPTRSHFDGQTYLENGTPGRKTTTDGWMARLLDVLPPAGGVRAIALGANVPLILTGRLPVANMPVGPGADRPTVADRPAVAAAFDRLYAADDPLGRAYREARIVRAEALGGQTSDPRSAEARMADNGAPPPGGFAKAAVQLARLIDREPDIQLAFLAYGDWDTHSNQGSYIGVLAANLRAMADGLVALARGLGPHYRDTVILVLSEFGRRLKENVSGGTDHGRGNVAWLLGGPVDGGRVFGQWPGLAADRLVEGLDLAVTTDYRAVAAVLIERLFRPSDRDLAHVFPDAPPGSAALAGLVNA
ncbi:MAG TPA: DUF1501 domain-containing protein [Candidatus Sulfotelmatobacter sp.]|nr:DUF1501 domain-containing protein [Candidatus Sulfotelmatobacter sp.]